MLTPATPPLEGRPSNALAILQMVQNRRFSLLAEASAHVKSLCPEERFEVVNSQTVKLVAVQDKADQRTEYLIQRSSRYHERSGYSRGGEALGRLRCRPTSEQRRTS